jgi:hypothetical protein
MKRNVEIGVLIALPAFVAIVRAHIESLIHNHALVQVPLWDDPVNDAQQTDDPSPAVETAALDSMCEHALVQRLATHKRRQFADEKAWTRHLECLGMADLPVTPDPVRVATEGAL